MGNIDRTRPASTPGKRDGLPRSAQAATAALDCWFAFQLDCLRDGTYDSIEQLAEANRLHPKVIRHLRLAFLSPEVTSAVLERGQPAGLSLAQIPKLLALPWAEHRCLLG